MEVLIKDLRNRVETKSRVSTNDLQTLLNKLRIQNVDSWQALEILRCCSYARLEKNQFNAVNNIWKELKKHDEDFSIQHYNYMLQFAKDRANVTYVQEIFDEMIKAKIKPNA